MAKRNHGIVLITGASAGIGRELAVEFALRAKTLVLVARRLDRLEKLRDELLERHPQLKVVALAADLSDESDIKALLGRVAEQAGDVDVLVNNAGLGDSVLFDQSDWTRTRQILRTNIFAVAQLTSALVPGMVERRRGGVLNIGSGAGLTVMPNAAAGFEQGAAVVFPGRAYRFVMRLLPFIPLALRRTQAAKTAAQLRAGQARSA